MDAQVYSGIAPPPELLDAMAEARANIKRKPTTDATSNPIDKLKTEGRKDSTSSVPPTPIEGPDSFDTIAFPAQQGSSVVQEPPDYTDAPPSYEDAIATNLAPVNAHRPDYAPPASVEDEILRSDEKKGFLSRRDS